MATTTNFGWETPDDTDLVKDGAAAMRTLGNSIDTSFVDLKGGTTGQVLSKASATDLDFTWVTDAAGDITGVTAGTGISGGGTSGTVTVTNSMATAITTAGDVIYGTGSGTFSRLGLGTAGQVLTVNTGATAPEWKTSAGGAAVGCVIYNVGNFTISNATETKLTFDSEILDSDGFHSTSANTSRITIPTGKGGKYYVFAWGAYANNTTGYRQMEIIINNAVGTPWRAGNDSASSANNMGLGPAGVAVLAAGDYIEVRTYQNSGGSLTLYGGANDLQFGAIYLGA